MFPVRKYGAALDEMAKARGIETLFGTELVAVDGPARRATFRDIKTGGSSPPQPAHPQHHPSPRSLFRAMALPTPLVSCQELDNNVLVPTSICHQHLW